MPIALGVTTLLTMSSRGCGIHGNQPRSRTSRSSTSGWAPAQCSRSTHCWSPRSSITCGGISPSLPSRLRSLQQFRRARLPWQVRHAYADTIPYNSPSVHKSIKHSAGHCGSSRDFLQLAFPSAQWSMPSSFVYEIVNGDRCRNRTVIV